MTDFVDDNSRQLQDDLVRFKNLVDRELDAFLPPADEPPVNLHKAMRYSTFAGGKRMRPILTMLSAQAMGLDPEKVLGPASAVELLHTYTLIHDDLPCMDDDDLRRGKPSCHKVFGQATALLAGDALLTASFGMLVETARKAGFLPEQIVRVVGELAQAAGTPGLVAGQMEDLEAEGKEITIDELQNIHRMKTGDLFVYAVRAGAVFASASEEHLEQITRFGELFGLLFQITDDILDVVGEEGTLGKPVGSDAQKRKATYPSILSLDDSWKIAEQTGTEACEFLDGLPGPTTNLFMLTARLLSRKS